MKRLITICLVVGIVLSATTANADLVAVDLANDVYKTTTGGQTLYWYLDLCATFNKTYDQQIQFADALTLNVSSVLDDWHMATALELPELLGSPIYQPSAQSDLVAAALDYCGCEPYNTVYEGRYDEEYPYTMPEVYHYYGKIYAPAYTTTPKWVPAYGVGDYPDSLQDAHIGTWVCTVP